MIIDSNILGFIASNRMKKSENKLSGSMKKLSSGLRVGKASDDVAGLGISEKMRAQIRGLNQGERNIQDGISLIQTAEAGLGEIESSYLQRMRELAVKAANSTLTSEDKSMIQEEIEQIKEGINDIADGTVFNNINVLRPPVQKTPPTIIGGKSDIIFIVDVSSSMGGTIDNVISNLDSFADKLTSSGVDFNLGLVSYSDTADGEPLTKWNFTSDAETFKNNMITMRSNMLFGGDSNESGLEGIKDPTNGALSFTLREDAAKQFIIVTDAAVHDNNTDSDGGDGRTDYDIDDIASELSDKSIKLTVVGPLSGIANTQLKRLSDPTDGNYFDVYGDFSTQLNAFAEDIIVDSGTTVELEEPLTIYIQTGADLEDKYAIKLFDARTIKLGIDDINVESFDRALEAITKMDISIEKVSEARGRFGSYQNTLEHIKNNVNNYSYNLTGAESRIRDVDIAKEMLDLTRNNILMQAAQTMLMQTNQKQQDVLQLLK